MSTTIEKIQRQIAENPILLYMKGSPKLPSCGFSAQAVQALAACGERFAYVDILQESGHSCGTAEICELADLPATVG